MTRGDVQRWLDGYVEAWRTYDPASIAALFVDDATYAYQPYNVWLLRFDDDRRCADFVEYWREHPKEQLPG